MNESWDSGIVSDGIVVEVNTMLDRRTVLKGVGCSRGAEEDRENGDGCFERYCAEGCGLCDRGWLSVHAEKLEPVLERLWRG